MGKNKLTLEDLKLESFLTELDNSKLIKVQGGNGAYGGISEDGGYCDPDTDEPTYSTNDEITKGQECSEGEYCDFTPTDTKTDMPSADQNCV